MKAETLKENIAKDVSYAFLAFAPEGEENNRSVYMRRNIYPAKRELIDYSGADDPEHLKAPWFVTPLTVLDASIGNTIGAFYEDMKAAFSVETENE